MKQIVILFLILIAVILSAAWSSQPGNLDRLIARVLPAPKSEVHETKEESRIVIKNGEKNIEIKVEIADSDEERRVGLTNRTGLGQEEGLLFVFDSKNIKPTFWMKDMKFPIDIIWINDDKIAQITENVPTAPDTPDNKIPRYRPKEEVDHVLEIAAGGVKRNGIAVGDSIQLLTALTVE